MYYYSISGDSLFCRGFENPTTLMMNEQPELLMKFPVNYGDSTFGYYNGNGRYCDRLRISAMGTTFSKADAYGMMVLPGGDTLKNVIRVHTIKKIADATETVIAGSDPQSSVQNRVSPDSIHHRLANDSVLLSVETYRWYARGYRYPIFETVKSITDKQGEERKFFDVAFFYPPQEHYVNEENENNEENKSNEGDENTHPWEGLTYNFHPNPVETILYIELYMPRQGAVRMQLTDRLGRNLWQENYDVRQEGIHNMQILMSPYPKGEYVLNMWFDGYLVGEKVIKK